MSNFHSRDISSLKYNYLELTTTVLTIHIHSLYITSRKSNLKRNIEHTISNHKMQILPGYRFCLDHCPVTYVQSYIHWVSFYLLKPYILFSSLLTSDIRIKSEFHHLLHLNHKCGKFFHSCSHPIVFDYSQVICTFLF